MYLLDTLWDMDRLHYNRTQEDSQVQGQIQLGTTFREYTFCIVFLQVTIKCLRGRPGHRALWSHPGRGNRCHISFRYKLSLPKH
jgi:hypothetical protein